MTQQHILITGASSGIGRELAIIASHAGFKLSLCGRNQDKLNTTLSALKADSQVFSDSFCVTDLNACKQFVQQSEAKFGTVDILINCAGLNSARGQGDEIDLADLDWMMKINCYAPIAFMQAVLPKMKAQQQGSILNVLSTVCLYANPGISAYTASKTAIDAYTKVMRKELKASHIKVLSIYPGGVDTEFRAAQRPQYLTAYAVAKACFQMLDSDQNTHIHELVLRPEVENNF
ncbi:SDR family oxidoreductase [Catenovulum sp. 2E275]|uniref:SDR family oxidoreductase n=1 Tax=Catenovulum sp. 2E275 TaxID=2980497 RepID=UPI0021D240CA|nr:SDR family oxidoreductase [Catenovulum sp. 2E275]MCU4674475.1 SDR family oxidoreductase [Catenovulum sp. 2E275]